MATTQSIRSCAGMLVTTTATRERQTRWKSTRPGTRSRREEWKAAAAASDQQPPGGDDAAAWACQLVSSFRHYTGRDLVPAASGAPPVQVAAALWAAPVVVVSHVLAADTPPVFNYGNACALALWEVKWDDFCGMPSRQSAPLEDGQVQEERQQALAAALERGFTTGYQGVRVSASGRLFRIKNATIWNIQAEDDPYQIVGQAAAFSEWEYIGDNA